MSCPTNSTNSASAMATNRLSSLECMNFDSLATILSACDSVTDLASFIHASPVVFKAFLSAKPAVLLQVATTVLGPVTRDAALLATSKPFPTDYSNKAELESHVDTAVKGYYHRLRVVAPPWVKTVDADTAHSLARITRTAESWVDIFGYFHCRRFKYSMDPLGKDCVFPHKPRLSQMERRRIAQAVVRQQLIRRTTGGNYHFIQQYLEKGTSITPLFHAWEWQQVSDMNSFLGALLEALRMYDRLQPRPPVRLKTARLKNTTSLDEFVRLFKRDLQSDSLLLDFLCDEYDFCGRIPAETGLHQLLKGSHYLTTVSPSENSRQLESQDDYIISSEGTSLSDPPWAWKDAMGEEKTYAWGHTLVGSMAHRSCPRCQPYVDKLERWRGYGLSFWDRERAETLLEMEELKSCYSGWLMSGTNYVKERLALQPSSVLQALDFLQASYTNNRIFNQ